MEGTILVTKVQVWIVPSKFKFGPKDQKLAGGIPGFVSRLVRQRQSLIRIEPTYNWHNEFGWTLAQFTPDMSQTVSMGLADLIYRLQDVITWLVNARVTDVRRNLRGRNLVNPTIVELKNAGRRGGHLSEEGRQCRDDGEGHSAARRE